MKVKLTDIKIGDRHRVDKGDINSMAQSLELYGQIQPVVITEDYQLIAGERRVLGANQLGWSELEAVFLKDVDPVRKLELELEENLQRKDLEWQEKALLTYKIHQLKTSLYGLRKPGSISPEGWTIKDTALSLGRSVGSIHGDIELAKKMIENPDLVDEETAFAAKKRAKWAEDREKRSLLSKAVSGETEDFRILEGDSREKIKEIASDSVDLVVTDPPFGLDLTNNPRMSGGGRWGNPASVDFVYSVDDSAKNTYSMLDEVFKETMRVMRPNSHLYCFYPPSEYTTFREMLTRAGFTVNPIPIIWHKIHGALYRPYKEYTNVYTGVFFASKGERLLRTQPFNVLTHAVSTNTSEKVHPLEIPFALLKVFIEASSSQGEVVFDPFAGGGSVLMTALTMSRKAVGIEIESMWVEAIKAKYSAMKGE